VKTPSLPGAQRRRLRRLAGLDASADTRRGQASRLASLVDRRPRAVAGYAALLAALAGGSLGGPVASLAAGAYAAAAVLLWAAARRARAERRAGLIALDLVAGIAADLRAGADPESVVAKSLPSLRDAGRQGAVLADRIGAACRVADAVGARLAELLDRLETDARGITRAQAVAAAQAAGAQATAWLLAALPAAGIGLGYGVGADPLRVLLHTRIGATCAVVAISFQAAGLTWSQRLTRSIRESAG
jgi:tight adherence protein B